VPCVFKICCKRIADSLAVSYIRCLLSKALLAWPHYYSIIFCRLDMGLCTDYVQTVYNFEFTTDLN
jgi:hypothetical protein